MILTTGECFQRDFEEICFFFDGAKVIITNAYEKKCIKMPMNEKQKALDSKVDYENRCRRKKYYE